MSCIREFSSLQKMKVILTLLCIVISVATQVNRQCTTATILERMVYCSHYLELELFVSLR